MHPAHPALAALVLTGWLCDRRKETEGKHACHAREPTRAKALLNGGEGLLKTLCCSKGLTVQPGNGQALHCGWGFARPGAHTEWQHGLVQAWPQFRCWGNGNEMHALRASEKLQKVPGKAKGTGVFSFYWDRACALARGEDEQGVNTRRRDCVSVARGGGGK